MKKLSFLRKVAGGLDYETILFYNFADVLKHINLIEED
jgi:hypothetical protein